MVPATGFVTKESWQVPRSLLFSHYESYLDGLFKGEKMPSQELRRFFSWMLFSAPEDLYAMPVSGGRWALKSRRPVIYGQLYHAFFSPADGKLHPMVLHPSSFSFGLQFSYPQLFEDPKTHVFHRVLVEGNFATTPLYKRLIAWIRTYTKPLILQVNHQAKPMPFRIGIDAQDPSTYHRGLP